MTWQLTESIGRSKLTIREAVNLLQLSGVISDNTITLEEIGSADSKSGAKWLDAHPFEVDDVIQNRPEEKPEIVPIA